MLVGKEKPKRFRNTRSKLDDMGASNKTNEKTKRNMYTRIHCNVSFQKSHNKKLTPYKILPLFLRTHCQKTMCNGKLQEHICACNTRGSREQIAREGLYVVAIWKRGYNPLISSMWYLQMNCLRYLINTWRKRPQIRLLLDPKHHLLTHGVKGKNAKFHPRFPQSGVSHCIA